MRTNYYKSKKQNHLKRTLSKMAQPGFKISVPTGDQGAQEVSFVQRTFEGATEIEQCTFVREQVNRRQQHLLKASNLTDIMQTIEAHGQMFPAIGVEQQDGRIEILDGSRRRQALILTEGAFKVWITQVPLSIEQATYIAKTANQTKRISEFELGVYFKSLIEQGICVDQKQVAERENLSKSKVSRCVLASEISPDLLDFFPDHNALSVRDIQRLIKVNKNRVAHHLSVQALLASCVSLTNIDQDSEEVKEQVLKQFEYAVKQPSIVQKVQPLKQKLYQASKDKFIEVARTEQRSVVTFSRIEQSKMEQVLKAIQDIVK
tara:strand:- start:212 stop:1168 length:957 start_codon:yes stop_codon:yes gene_type:complete